MWIPNAQLEEASHFARSLLATAVASDEWRAVWPLVSVLYNLDGDAPFAFGKLLEKSQNSTVKLRSIERWAEQAAKPAHTDHDVGVVIPSTAGLQRWLSNRVRAFREFEEILTNDPPTLLALARGAD